MLSAIEITQQLERICGSSDFSGESDALAETWVSAAADLAAVEPILRFMESNPGVDYGLPGALVHFVERFHTMGYESELVASLARQPTPHTVWMLRRLINGTKDTTARVAYISAMQRARTHLGLSEALRRDIEHHLSGLVSAQ
jgi:hypothetical protein